MTKPKCKIWAICGAGRGVGKTTIARSLVDILPSSVYAKCGHNQKKPQKPEIYFNAIQELTSFIADSYNDHEHIIIESNAYALTQNPDHVIYIDGREGTTNFRDDCEKLKSLSHIQICAESHIEKWQKTLRQTIKNEETINSISSLFQSQKQYLFARSFDMISLSDALAAVDSTLAGKSLKTKNLPVKDALGYVLAADQISKLQLPPFNKSAMDGYAVCADDDRDEYKVLEFVPAGSVPTLALTKGCATKVMTGAAVPENAGKVIMVEFTEEKDGVVKVTDHSSRTNICKMGEDINTGDTILYAPVTLGALEIANLISCGIETVKVFESVKVSIISTGDEIVDSFDKIEPGKIMNSNSPLLSNLCKQKGLEVVDCQTIADDRAETGRVISKAVDVSDIIILSGGVSMGDLDFVDTAMRDIGLDVHYNRVAVKPGKPMTYATKNKKAIFGLPGNPVSVYLMFHVFVMRAVKVFLGIDPEIDFISYELAETYKRKKNDRTQFVPCKITKNAKIKPIKYHGSAHLIALMQSDGFFIIEKGISEIAKGKTVSFMNV